MAQARCAAVLWLLLSLAISYVLVDKAGAVPVIWTGPAITFTKTLGDPTDEITNNVWITRGSSQGIYNSKTEGSFTHNLSPDDTEWATCFNNVNSCSSILAANGPVLNYVAWENAYGGTSNLAINITQYPAVVHLKTDDVYLDLKFTQWPGGGFTYQRSTPPTGDYNNDGIVDAADYVVWRRTLNQSTSFLQGGADGNGNGTIDSGDYAFWRSRFGNALFGSGAGISTVPEPASLAAVLEFVAILVCNFRRRRSMTNRPAEPGGSLKITFSCTPTKRSSAAWRLPAATPTR